MTGRTISHYNRSGRMRGIYCQDNAAVKPILRIGNSFLRVV